jgi:hypothetical protein
LIRPCKASLQFQTESYASMLMTTRENLAAYPNVQPEKQPHIWYKRRMCRVRVGPNNGSGAGSRVFIAFLDGTCNGRKRLMSVSGETLPLLWEQWMRHFPSVG